MMSKLFYQEHLDQSRKIASLLGIVLLSALVSLGITATGIPAISTVAQLVIFIGAIAAPMLTLLMVAIHYWTSMYTDTGYFTHQIPATAAQLFWAKVLYAVCALVVSLIVSAISMLIYVIASGWRIKMSLRDSLNSAYDLISATPSALIIIGLIAMLVNCISVIIGVAGTISYCAQDKYIRHGFTAPAIGLVVYYILYQVTSLPAMLLIPGSIKLSDGTFTWQIMLTDFIDAVNAGSQPSIIGMGIIFSSTALAALAAWLGIRSLRNHLSLR
ncbi:hypothetical protein [Arcanobacterium phocae]|uniref:hypothetical protein n=1 Tax=Arcanobacterium phocae TaxID=131112 RepID=UPI001C0EFC9C|nr:hypothetical protein [Arcanobacterium phocae]